MFWNGRHISMSASNPLGHVACKASVANPGPGPGDIVIISAREEACAIPDNSIHCTLRVVNSYDDVGKSVVICSCLAHCTRFSALSFILQFLAPISLYMLPYNRQN